MRVRLSIAELEKEDRRLVLDKKGFTRFELDDELIKRILVLRGFDISKPFTKAVDPTSLSIVFDHVDAVGNKI